MRARIALLALIALLCAAASASAAPPETLSGTEQRVTTDPGDQYDSAISGNIVVFTDYRVGGHRRLLRRLSAPASSIP